MTENLTQTNHSSDDLSKDIKNKTAAGASAGGKQSMPFQAEVKEILSMMVHSLYSQKEIFLRELISNASDALDKLRFEAIAHKDWKVSDTERTITLTPDPSAHLLKIEDNGIGMTYEEVVKNIGTIAHSGTREFIKAKQEIKDRPELIGQFGVGFYSAFMVADRVSLHTQHAGENDGTLWESAGDGEYTVSRVPRPGGHGTTITLHLKPQPTEIAESEPAQNFTDEWTLRSIVKKYSDFISFPIRLVTRPKAEPGKDEPEAKIDVINSQKAIWLRNPSEIKPEEYAEFYHHIAHDWSEPFRTIHFKAEGTQEFAALMFIPKDVPHDYHYRDTKFGLSLYIRRVFIMAHCEDLQPHYLRFVKGLVDSSDLPLNVSREILQKDVQTQKMQKAIVGKILGHLKDLMAKERADYETFWTHFGPSIKEGLVTDHGNKEKLSDLLLVRSTAGEQWSSLGEYVGRMKPEQKAVYYVTGDSVDLLKNSPYLERLKDKGYEVIFLTDTVDEWLTNELKEYKGKKLISITSDELDLDSAEEKQAKEEDNKKAEEKFGGLKKFIEETLREEIKEVRFSDRLIESPVCLISVSDDPSARMSRILESMGKAAPKVKRILEINPKHLVFEKILALDESRKKDWVEIIYSQALLNEGSPIADPTKLSRQISNLMIQA